MPGDVPTGHASIFPTVSTTPDTSIPTVSTMEPSVPTNISSNSTTICSSASTTNANANTSTAANSTTTSPANATSTNAQSNLISDPSCPNTPSATSPAGTTKNVNYCLSSFSVLNVAGLKTQTTPSKVPYVELILKDKNELFMALTETWLKGHTQAELNIEGYKLYRADRKGRKHTRGRYSGGTALYLRGDIAATTEKLLDYSNGVVETLAVYSERENLVICVIYRQPDDPVGQHQSKAYQLSQAITKIENMLEELQGTPNIIFCGDFNIPNTNWSEIESDQSKDNSLATVIKSFQTKHLLNQMVHKPTHKSGNILDLIFTNNKQLFNEIHVIPTTRSDHHIIEVATHFKSHFSRSQKTIRQFSNIFDSLNFFSDDVDWAKMKTELQSHDWNQAFSEINDPVDKLNHLIKTCEVTSSANVPKKRVSISKKSKIPRDRRILMRRRRKITKRLPNTTNKTIINKLSAELIEIEMKLQQSIQNSTNYQEDKAIQAIKRNPKYFFTYVKKFSKVKPAIGPLLDKNNSYIVESIDMANLLKDQYSSVFSTPKEPPIDPNELFENEPDTLNDIEFTPEDVKKAINDISANAAPGPDGFPAILLRNCKDELASPLHHIWRQCLDLGITPPSLKFSRIIPIHKGDSTAIPKNYRPVALTSHLVKVFEKILRAKIVNYLEENNLCNPSQHGFRAGRSCLSQLLTHYDKILTLLDQGQNVDVVYLDFAKAFDKLDFNITLQKLKMLGITGKIGKWIHSFLTNRMQAVAVNGEQSSPAPVISGVPQGSVIGPLLFLILIGDIDKDVYHAFLSSFADDTRVGKGISSEEDARLLQQDLECVYAWATENNMLFNDIKFELLRYGNNSTLKENTQYISNTGEQIESKSSTKDLGVTMSASADFTEHIENVTETVKDLISWILRSFKSRSKLLMLQLWKSLVIPRLDYCSQLWNPSKSYLIRQLEELQKTFIKRIAGFREKDYITALKDLRLYSLQRRRERYQIIYLWSILESVVPNIDSTDNQPLVELQSIPNSRRGRTIAIPKLKNSRFGNLRYSSLPFHGARLFNSLPKQLRNLSGCSKMVFKCKLDEYLNKLPDQPLLPNQFLTQQAPANSILNQTTRWDQINLVGCL